MKILVACEFTGVVRDAFRALGHNAISCDLEPSERPGPHYQGDVRDILYDVWDMLIAFPPCTYLSYASMNIWNTGDRPQRRGEALEFVRLLMDAPIERIAIENPKGEISRSITRETQVIQPYYFGHEYRKHTCLWLKNLPPLLATCVCVERKEFVKSMAGGKARTKNRSRTFQGVADAMASQWGLIA